MKIKLIIITTFIFLHALTSYNLYGKSMTEELSGISLGDKYYFEGKYVNAVKEYIQFSKKFKKNKYAPEALFKAATLLYLGGIKTGARRAYIELVEEFPYNMWSDLVLSKILTQNELFTIAENFYEQARKNQSQYYSNLSTWVYQKILSRFQIFPFKIWYRIGVNARTAGKDKEAKLLFSKAKDGNTIWSALAKYTLSPETCKIENMEELLLKYGELVDVPFFVLDQTGHMLKTSESKSLIPRIHFIRGMCYYLLEDYIESRSELSEIIKLDPDNTAGYTSSALFYLAHLYLMKNFTSDAKDALQRIIKNFPSSFRSYDAKRYIPTLKKRETYFKKFKELFRKFLTLYKGNVSFVAKIHNQNKTIELEFKYQKSKFICLKVKQMPYSYRIIVDLAKRKAYLIDENNLKLYFMDEKFEIPFPVPIFRLLNIPGQNKMSFNFQILLVEPLKLKNLIIFKLASTLPEYLKNKFMNNGFFILTEKQNKLYNIIVERPALLTELSEIIKFSFLNNNCLNIEIIKPTYSGNIYKARLENISFKKIDKYKISGKYHKVPAKLDSFSRILKTIGKILTLILP